MGLISEEVEIVLNPRNINHYKSLNYELPKIKNKSGKIKTTKGSKIKVKVEDLLKGSNIKVSVKCDCCNEILQISW